VIQVRVSTILIKQTLRLPFDKNSVSIIDTDFSPIDCLVGDLAGLF
jgi:hypothetical protein